MNIEAIYDILASIRGCTFATLSAETRPIAGIRHVVEGQRVMLFTNKHSSGYENMVKRRLASVGKNPDDFVVGDLPWGERIPETPMIRHRGEIYLQTILLAEGVSKYYLGLREINPDDFGLKRKPNQGLGERSVIVNAYNIKSINSLTVNRQTLRLAA